MENISIPKSSLALEVEELLTEDFPRRIKKGDQTVQERDEYKGLPSTVDLRSLPNLINAMKHNKGLNHRLEASRLLLSIEDHFLLTKFMQHQGTSVISEWISEYKDKIEKNDQIDNDTYELLINIIDFADKLPILVSDLKSSKIGKKINKIGKMCNNLTLKSKCEDLVEKWKRMIEDIKGKKEDKGSRKAPSTSQSQSEEQREDFLRRKREDENFSKDTHTDRSFKKYITVISNLTHIQYSLRTLKMLLRVLCTFTSLTIINFIGLDLKMLQEIITLTIQTKVLEVVETITITIAMGLQTIVSLIPIREDLTITLTLTR